MPKKYMKVLVSRTLTTDLYVEVDEDDERYKGLFESGDLKSKSLSVSKALRAISPLVTQAIEETVSDSDWEKESGYEVECIEECSKEEATQFAVFQIPKE
jgi:hypothetical protein